MRTVLANATVIDCVSPRPVPGASVTIDRGRIVEVLGAGRSADTRDAQVIDLEGAYLLPGLWDVHIHPDYLASTGASVAEQTAIFGHRLMQALTESGVVGVRCAGAGAPLSSGCTASARRSPRASRSSGRSPRGSTRRASAT